MVEGIVGLVVIAVAFVVFAAWITREWRRPWGVDKPTSIGARPLLCRLGFHHYGTMWQNIAPASGGGPSVVEEGCRRCFHRRVVRNWR